MISKSITIQTILFATVCSLYGCGLSANSKTDQQMSNTITWQAMPDLPGTTTAPSLGVSAPFTGIHNGVLMVAGGCNFPDKPVTEGGAKKYYDALFVFNIETNSFEPKAYKIPAAVAYGMAVTTPKGIVCMGGNNSDTKFTETFLLQWDKATKQPIITALPQLPATMDNMAATFIDNKVYVMGGSYNGAPSNALIALDLDKTDAGWSVLTSFPGAARVQPIAVATTVAGESYIYLAAGFQPAINGSEPIVSCDMLRYQVSSNTWNKECEIPAFEDGNKRTLVGGTAIAVDNTGELLFMSGVNYNRFCPALLREQQQQIATAANNSAVVDSLKAESKAYLLQPQAWYQFNTSLLRYNPADKSWSVLGEHPQLARAGAGIATINSNVYIVNGESKPGIRTPSINCMTLK